MDCVTGEMLEEILAVAQESPWSDPEWAKTLVIGSWCGGEDRAEEVKAQIRRETRAGVEALRAHFGIRPPV